MPMEDEMRGVVIVPLFAVRTNRYCEGSVLVRLVVFVYSG